MIVFLLTMIIVLILAMGIPSPVRMVKKMLQKLSHARTTKIFGNGYIEAKELYLFRFGVVPNETYIANVDMSKAYGYINENYGDLIIEVFQSSYFNREDDKQVFRDTIFVLKAGIMIELAGEFVEIFHTREGYEFADKVLRAMKDFTAPEKEKEYEINIITYTNNKLGLKRLDIKPTNLDINLYYNDDFARVDELVRTRLAKENDKGIVLLHGLPGTGKTTYLRHLIGSLDKKVLFVSPSAAGNLMDPDFIDLLIDNPNAVLVIEDAENIMMDRKYNHGSSVSNLLNLSDGLLSDCLGVHIICTFNSDLNLIDPALLRQGRLIARYEFGKLGIEKAKKLSVTMGFDNTIDKPMTIAEIANQHEVVAERKIEVIGFRRHETMMN